MKGLIVVENRGFARPRRDAETGYCYRYLARFDTPGACGKLAAKMARTPNRDGAGGLLKTFTKLRTPEPRAVLIDRRRIRGERRAESPERLKLPSPRPSSCC